MKNKHNNKGDKINIAEDGGREKKAGEKGEDMSIARRRERKKIVWGRG